MSEEQSHIVNPYESPYAETAVANGVLESADVYSKVGRVAVTWEKLRLLFNLILVGVTVVAIPMSPVLPADGRFVSDLVLGVVVSNALFCLGPLIDGYLTWFGLRSNAITTFLFVSGTAVTSLLALYSIVTW